MIPFSVIIEEYEQGAWTADIVSIEQFAGSFDFAGETWAGSMVSERLEFERWHTSIVGGAGGLGKTIADKFYSGSVSLQVAVQDVCREAGETFGAAQTGKFLSTFARSRGNAASALDSIAEAFGMIWWIDRDGSLNMQAARDVGDEATGSRIESSADSCLLVDPEDLTLGATYGEDAEPVRHIRWEQDATRFAARIYFYPFIFRPPVERRYDSLRSASVERQNTDGTIDLKTDAGLGMSKVPLLCGVPGAKVTVNAGELVTVGFFAGDPQKPFAMAMAQNTSATKSVARNGDTCKVTIPAGSFLISCSGSPAVGVSNVNPIDVTGTITSGSDRLKVGD